MLGEHGVIDHELTGRLVRAAGFRRPLQGVTPTGDDIEVLERGLGKSPWDPRRVVVDDTRPPVRWSE